MTFLKLFFANISGKFWFVLGGIAAALALIYKGVRLGEGRAQAQQKEREYEAQKLRADVAEEVSAMSDADVTGELRKYAAKRDKLPGRSSDTD